MLTLRTVPQLQSQAPLTGSGTTWTFGRIPPPGAETVKINGIEWRRVVSGPGIGEYTIAGATVTLGSALAGGDQIWGALPW